MMSSNQPNSSEGSVKLAAKRVCGKILMTLAEGIASDIGAEMFINFTHYTLSGEAGGVVSGMRNGEGEEGLRSDCIVLKLGNRFLVERTDLKIQKTERK